LGKDFGSGNEGEVGRLVGKLTRGKVEVGKTRRNGNETGGKGGGVTWRLNLRNGREKQDGGGKRPVGKKRAAETGKKVKGKKISNFGNKLLLSERALKGRKWCVGGK